MTDATLLVFRSLAESLQTEPATWQWIGPHMSQRLFGLTKSRALRLEQSRREPLSTQGTAGDAGQAARTGGGGEHLTTMARAILTAMTQSHSPAGGKLAAAVELGGRGGRAGTERQREARTRNLARSMGRPRVYPRCAACEQRQRTCYHLPRTIGA